MRRFKIKKKKRILIINLLLIIVCAIFLLSYPKQYRETIALKDQIDTMILYWSINPGDSESEVIRMWNDPGMTIESIKKDDTHFFNLENDGYSFVNKYLKKVEFSSSEKLDVDKTDKIVVYNADAYLFYIFYKDSKVMTTIWLEQNDLVDRKNIVRCFLCPL